jgi:hypothetical protein
MAVTGDPGFLIGDEAGNYYLIPDDLLRANKVTDPGLLEACAALSGADVQGFSFPGQSPTIEVAGMTSLAPIGSGYMATRLSPSLGLRFC